VSLTLATGGAGGSLASLCPLSEIDHRGDLHEALIVVPAEDLASRRI